ncbi:nucleotidyltransferase domain-containing protein [Candidatus Woesearchaeota archaeon]|nr:nucleotidyltransferase domain-containing protein [Candidatus Woesearchaeota archaeon]
MEFKIERKGNENYHKYPTDNLKKAQEFANDLKKEFDTFVLAIVLFGSSARRQEKPTSDIDVLVVTDDTTFIITEPLIEAYRLTIEKLVPKISLQLHITSMTFTSFWEHVRGSDPVTVNILRDGVPLLDVGFFTPLQQLLKQGRIRPSEESVWRYYGQAPRTLVNSRWHVLQATLDLYWAVIDSAHAALMSRNEVPPTPEHVPEMLERVFVKHRLLEKNYVDTMQEFYKLSKMITHRELREVKGPEYEKYYHQADDFVKRMKRLIEGGRL